MRIPFLALRPQYLELKDEIDAAVMRVLDSGWYILGAECESFENSFKEYLADGSEGYVVAVNSGTDALKLALLAAGVGPGDEVITAANTAIPTATAICSVGAVPVFCDVDPYTWLIDPEKIPGCITRRTKAIIPVHLYGGVCEMEALQNVARSYGVALIEDVAQATGSGYKGRRCGTVGNFGAYSFYPSKNLGANGDGGALFVQSAEVGERLRWLRNYGQSSRYRADLTNGENSRLDELQAAVLSVKLNHLDRWNARRKELEEYYRRSLSCLNLPIQLQSELPGTSVARHLFVITLAPHQRDIAQQKLLERGIQTLVHYPTPLYLQPAFATFQRGVTPHAEHLCNSVLSLPFHQYLTETDIDFISEELHAVMTSFRI